MGDIKRLVRHRAIYPALLIIGLWFFVPGTGTPLQFYLTNGLHLSDSVYADFRAILSISNIPGILLYGVLCRRFSLNKMLWWGTAIATPGLIPLVFIHTASLVLLAATMSLTWGFAWAAYIDLAIRSCPPGLQGTMMMLVAGATVLLTNAGDLVGAKIYSSSATHGFLYCVIAATVTTALILPAILLVPRQLIATADGEPSRAIEAELVKELGTAGHSQVNTGRKQVLERAAVLSSEPPLNVASGKVAGTSSAPGAFTEMPDITGSSHSRLRAHD